MNLKALFSRFLGAKPDRLHFAAHSHHPWPDVSFEAHQLAWLDAAEMMDNKWEHIFGDVFPDARTRVADVLGLAEPATLTFGPNTHSFLLRIFSCLEPPVRVLSTDAEFHSFTRQSRRWEEEGLAIVDRIPTEPFDTFGERFTREARAGVHDLVYLSQVFYDSGYAVTDLDQIVSSVPENRTIIVIDGYHAFMARPMNLGAIQDRVFFLAGGLQIRHVRRGRLLSPLSAGLWAPPARYRLVRRIRPARIWCQSDDRLRRRRLAVLRRHLRPVRGLSNAGGARLARIRRSHAVQRSTSMSSRFRTDSLRAAPALGDLLVGDGGPPRQLPHLPVRPCRRHLRTRFTSGA